MGIEKILNLEDIPSIQTSIFEQEGYSTYVKGISFNEALGFCKEAKMKYGEETLVAMIPHYLLDSEAPDIDSYAVLCKSSRLEERKADNKEMREWVELPDDI